MATFTYTLPAHWAPYLINGDESGLSVMEALQIEGFLAGEGLFTNCLSCTDEEGDFRTYHDATPYGVLACNCLAYTFEVTP